MLFTNLLEEFRVKFSEHGEFILLPDESIKKVVVREGVSVGYGVYIISACHPERREIVYVGKSGTLLQNGIFKRQGIRKRLTMKQDKKIYREAFFINYIRENSLEGLHIEWFVTYTGNVHVLPLLAEAQLLAAYFTEFKYLPLLNRAC